jgi:hypothetical protein
MIQQQPNQGPGTVISLCNSASGTVTTFQEAYTSARNRYSDVQWYTLDARDQSEAIYLEMRRLDALAVMPQRSSSSQSSPIMGGPKSRWGALATRQKPAC